MKIKNKDLIPVINFLNGLKVKGLKSIQRTNFTKKLQIEAEKYIEDQRALNVEYSFNKEGLIEDFEELSNQVVNINETDNKVEISVIKEITKPLVSEESEHEFEGGDAIAISCLYEALELGD